MIALCPAMSAAAPKLPLVEIAPGKVCPPPVLPATGPGYTIAEVVPLGGGAFRLQPRPAIEWLGMTQSALRRVGITLSENTLRRLGRAGFIQVRPISPNRYEFNWQSWLAHCAAVESDPEGFWDAREDLGGGRKGPTNREKYLKAL
ncbi:MAG: hypothetical protein HZA93_24040 [Verrucomicrobia bacterium]|nr:hypothetical protein [Verrucomicrobiota bacterium]